MNDEPTIPNSSVEDVLEAKGALHDPTHVLSAAPQDSVYDCIDRMAKIGVGSIVVTADGAIAGIFTERDHMRKMALKGRAPKDTAVRTAMTEEVATVTPDQSLEDALDRMRDLQCRHLPVVDADGQLSGIISMRDCMRQLSEAAKSRALRLIEHMERSTSCASTGSPR
jgi:CBS domain-containing protein